MHPSHFHVSLPDTSLLQQTSRELEEKIFRAEQEGKQIDKTIEYLHRQLSKVNAEYYERKRQVEALESENFVSQNEGLEKLKVLIRTISIQFYQTTRYSTFFYFRRLKMKL